MNHFEQLRQKFSSLDAKVILLNELVLRDLSAAESERISKAFTERIQFERINEKRLSLINEVDSILRKLIDALNRDKYANTPHAFAKVLNDPLELKKLLVSKLELKGRVKYVKASHDDFQSFLKSRLNFMNLVVRNDWSIFKKFYYYSLIAPRAKTVHWPDRHNSYIYLNDESYLIHFRSEFCLVNKFFDLVKRIKLRSNFNVKSIHTVDSDKIVAHVQRDLSPFSHVCVFDFRLNFERAKKVATGRIRFCETHFFYDYTPLLNNKTVASNCDWIIKMLSYDLKQVDEINLEMFKGTVKQLLFVLEDKVIFRHHMDSDVTIRVAQRSNLNASIKIAISNHLDTDQFFVIKVERQIYLYFFNIARFDEDSKLVFCYDLDGRFMFKRVVPLVDQCFEIDFMNGRTVRFNNTYSDTVVLL
jgi:hypothetical protein